MAGAGLILIVDSVRDAGVTIDGLKRGFVPLKLFLEASREGLMRQTTSGGMTNLVVIGKVPPTRDSMHIQTYINITIHTYVYIYMCVFFTRALVYLLIGIWGFPQDRIPKIDGFQHKKQRAGFHPMICKKLSIVEGINLVSSLVCMIEISYQ